MGSSDQSHFSSPKREAEPTDPAFPSGPDSYLVPPLISGWGGRWGGRGLSPLAPLPRLLSHPLHQRLAEGRTGDLLGAGKLPGQVVGGHPVL